VGARASLASKARQRPAAARRNGKAAETRERSAIDTLLSRLGRFAIPACDARAPYVVNVPNVV